MARYFPWSYSGRDMFELRRLRFALFATVLSPLISFSASAEIRVVAYVPNWVDLKSFSETIDYSKLTHINIAFANPTNDDGKLSVNPDDQILMAKARVNHVKVLISIGGGSAAEDKVLLKRYAHLMSANARRAFAAKLRDYVLVHGFDGLDVDIEGPGITGDYGAFIAELSKVLKPSGKLLTAAVADGYGGNRVPESTFAQFDFVNVMAYDATGPWNPKEPGQHSSMEFAKENVAYWLRRGLQKSKLVLGVPFYGYGFGDAFRKSDYAYAAIVAAHPGAENADQTGKTIWYNGIPTIKTKTQLVIDQGLGGVMIWSLDSDAKGKQSLLAAIHQTLAAKRAVSHQ